MIGTGLIRIAQDGFGRLKIAQESSRWFRKAPEYPALLSIVESFRSLDGRMPGTVDLRMA